MAPLPLIDGCPYPIWWTSSQYVIIVMYLIAFLHSLHTLYRFIKNKHKETSKIKYAIPLGFASICTASFLFIFDITTYWCFAVCNGVLSFWFLLSIVLFLFTYALQNLLLLIIIFVKLEAVFIGTIYKISKLTIVIYKTVFIILPILMLNWPIGFIFPQIERITFYIGSVVLFIVLLVHISMVILIIYKLVHVYKDTTNKSDSSNNDNDHIISAITKLTILSCMTMMISLIVSVLILLQAITFGNISTEEYMTYAVFRFLDGYSTFLSTIMCYRIFKGDYQLICSCLDARCYKCWRKIIGGNDNKDDAAMNLDQVNAVTSVTSPSDDIDLESTRATAADTQRSEN